MSKKTSRNSGISKWWFLFPVIATVLGVIAYFQIFPKKVDIRSQTAKYIAYHDTIELTPEQIKIKEAALSSIPAPCCNDKPMLTCCCPCNLARAAWGQTHYLITKRNYNIKQVKKAIEEWIRSINPGGFSGDACYTGGCMRPFNKNGCGGMVKDMLIF